MKHVIDPPRDVIEVLIESPRFTHIKRKTNGRIDFISPLPCPFNYGCVPQSISGDGDPIDVVLLGPRLPRGTRAQSKVVAVVDFIDAGDADPKWICSNAAVTWIDRITVHSFFVIYAVTKRALNTVRGKQGVTAYRGLRWCAEF